MFSLKKIFPEVSFFAYYLLVPPHLSLLTVLVAQQTLKQK